MNIIGESFLLALCMEKLDSIDNCHSNLENIVLRFIFQNGRGSSSSKSPKKSPVKRANKAKNGAKENGGKENGAKENGAKENGAKESGADDNGVDENVVVDENGDRSSSSKSLESYNGTELNPVEEEDS